MQIHVVSNLFKTFNLLQKRFPVVSPLLFPHALLYCLLKGGKVVEGLSGQVLKPSRLDILVNTEKLSQPPLEPVRQETSVTLTKPQDQDSQKAEADQR